MGTGLLLLVSYVLLLLGLLVNWGAYDPMALTLLMASFALIVLAFVWAWRKDPRDRKVPGVPVFAIAVVVLLLAAVAMPVAMYLIDPLYERLYHIWLAVLAGLVGIAYLAIRRDDRRIRRAVFVIAILGALAFRLWMPVASPAPVIDVFSFSQESAQHLLEGKNPYSTPVSDVYQGAVDFGYAIKAYIYLPADLFVQTASYGLTGDVRYASVLAECLIAFALWSLSRRRWSESTAELFVLLFLYNPRSLFVLEQAWVDPLIVAFFALWLLLRDRGKRGAAAMAYGYLLVLKQYMLFAFFQWLIVERNWKRVLTALALGAATLLPFALWDWRSLLDNGILFNVVVPFRNDGLTLFSLLDRTWGLRPPAGWTIVVGAALAALAFVPQKRMLPLRGYLFAVVITLFGMFLFGTTGFCNWYYLVAGLLIFLLSVGTRLPKTKGRDAVDEAGFAAD